MAVSGQMDPDTLRTAYTVLGAERVDYNVRKWDVIRIAALFAVAIFAASGGLLSQDKVPQAGYVVAGPAVMLFAGVLWWWAHTGIKRESRLQYSVEFSMYQIELLLGLHAELAPEHRWLPDQASAFSDKHVRWQHRTVSGDEVAPTSGRDLEWWLDHKVKTHGFVGAVDLLFACFFLASVGFGVALLTVGL